MPAWVILFATLLLPQSPPETPVSILAQANAAVEGDSVAPLRARWLQRVTADSTDRAAQLGLASLDRLTYDYESAERRLDRLSGTDGWALYARTERAVGDLWRRPFEQTGYKLLAVAHDARAVHDSALASAALAVAGFVGSRLGILSASLDSLEAAYTLAPEREVWLRGRILCTRAPILSFAGLPGAMATVQQGLALAREAGDRRAMGLCYHAVAMVAINEVDDAAITEAYTDSSAAVQAAAHDGPMLALSYYTKGYSRYSYGDFAGAKQSFAKAIVEAERTGSPFVVAWSRRIQSMLYWTAGDVPASMQDFAQAESLFTLLNDGMGLSHVQNGRAFAQLTTGRIDEAEATFRQQLALSERNGLAEGVFANLRSLSAVRGSRGDWVGARDELERAIVYGNSHGHAGWTASLDYRRGVIALRMGELDTSERFLRRFLSLAGPEQYFDRYAARTRLAEIAARRGRLDEAVAGLQDAARQLDSMRHALTDTQLRLLVFQTGSALDEPDLGLAPIAALLVKGNRAPDAFLLAEQRRARTLEEQIITSALLRGDSATATSAIGEMPALATVQAGLPQGLAVIAWLAGRGRAMSTAFVVTRRSVQGVVLPSIDSVAHDIDRYTALLEQGESTEALGRRLADALLLPALALLPPEVDRLILIPDDRLHRLPFDALPLADGAPLLSRYGVSRAPSTAIAARLAKRPVRTGAVTLLALGDPATAASSDSGARDPQTERYAGAFANAGGLPRLAGSAAEVTGLRRYSSHAIVKLRKDASEAYLKTAALQGFRIIHLASHALVDDQSESRTSLALAPGEGEDGFLGASEIGTLQLDADLVVLSACRSAAGQVIGGEGVQGLVAPLIGAGARTVVASLWPIGDQRTAALMETFYDGMAEGKTVGEALRMAKLAARDRGEPARVWAAFTLVGDPDVRIPLERRRLLAPWFYLGLVALLVLGFIVLKIKGRAP